MAQIAESVKHTVEGLTKDVKASQLHTSTVDPSEASSGTHITTMHGTRIANTDTWLKAADSRLGGPALLEDHIALEKIHRFDHERIPERCVLCR